MTVAQRLLSSAENATARIAVGLKKRSAADRLVRRNPLYFSRALHVFDRLEAATLEERILFTEKRLRAVLSEAGSRSRYGRSAGGGERLSDWPLLEKESVRDAPLAFVPTRWRHLAVRASTSGTTGTPLRLFRTLRSVVVEQAAIDRIALSQGVDLGTARLVVLRGDDVGRPGADGPIRRDDLGGRRRVLRSNDLSADTLHVYADAIDGFAPHCLLAYPTVLESLCRLLEQTGRTLSIPLTLTSSEVLTTAARRLAEQALQTRVADYYGQAERVSFAYSLREDAYTFLPGYGHTELLPLDEDDERQTFEIVGTSLWNSAMSLVRYRTGDLVVLPKGTSGAVLEELCYGLRPLPSIAGRRDDVLVAPDGGRLVGVDHIPRDVMNVVRLQVVQERRDFVRICVLPKAGFGEPDRQRIAENVTRKLPPTISFSIEVVDALERSQLGKTPLVIRRPGV